MQLAERRPTLGSFVRRVQQRLADGGIAEAGLETRRLVAQVAGIAPEELFLRPETQLDPACVAALEEAVIKRLGGMPIGRITGERSFYGRSFRLNSATLEPRPDSETLIDAVLEIVSEAGQRERPLRIVDVGTGTGCLLITLLAELPFATGLGIDLAPGALVAARENAERHLVSERAAFVLGDALEEVSGPFDLLVSNPPYILRGEIASLDEEVRCHDPLLALDGGNEGLDIYKKIFIRLKAVVPRGWAFLEIGAGMGPAVRQLADNIVGRRATWRVWPDLNGIDRCVAYETPCRHDRD